MAVIGVDSNETSDADGNEAARRGPRHYPVVVDPQAKVATQYLVQALPVSYFLNASGRVVGAALGPQTRVVAGALGGPARCPAMSPVERTRERATSLRLTPRPPTAIAEPAAPPIDRAAALAEGAPGIPAKFVYWVLGVVLVLSLGGLLGGAPVLLGRAQPGPDDRAATRRAAPVPAATPGRRRPTDRSTRRSRRSWA